MVVGATVFCKLYVPVVPVEFWAVDKSVQTLLSLDPCNLNVLPTTEESAHVARSISKLATGIGNNASNLNSSLPTQFIEGSNADLVVAFPSIANPIKLVV